MAENSDPWYAAGLRFRCTQCGKCCTGEPGFVWVNAREVQAIAEYLGQPREEFIGLYTKIFAGKLSLREKANGDCVFYDSQRGCTIYPLRPRQCQTWPFWESNVESPRAWEKTCAICPGSGTGDLITVEEITHRLKVIPL